MSRRSRSASERRQSGSDDEDDVIDFVANLRKIQSSLNMSPSVLRTATTAQPAHGPPAAPVMQMSTASRGFSDPLANVATSARADVAAQPLRAAGNTGSGATVTARVYDEAKRAHARPHAVLQPFSPDRSAQNGNAEDDDAEDGAFFSERDYAAQKRAETLRRRKERGGGLLFFAASDSSDGNDDEEEEQGGVDMRQQTLEQQEEDVWAQQSQHDQMRMLEERERIVERQSQFFIDDDDDVGEYEDNNDDEEQGGDEFEEEEDQPPPPRSVQKSGMMTLASINKQNRGRDALFDDGDDGDADNMFGATTSTAPRSNTTQQLQQRPPAPRTLDDDGGDIDDEFDALFSGRAAAAAAKKPSRAVQKRLLSKLVVPEEELRAVASSRAAAPVGAAGGTGRVTKKTLAALDDASGAAAPPRRGSAVVSMRQRGKNSVSTAVAQRFARLAAVPLLTPAAARERFRELRQFDVDSATFVERLYEELDAARQAVRVQALEKSIADGGKQFMAQPLERLFFNCDVTRNVPTAIPYCACCVNAADKSNVATVRQLVGAGAFRHGFLQLIAPPDPLVHHRDLPLRVVAGGGGGDVRFAVEAMSRQRKDLLYRLLLTAAGDDGRGPLTPPPKNERERLAIIDGALGDLVLPRCPPSLAHLKRQRTANAVAAAADARTARAEESLAAVVEFADPPPPPAAAGAAAGVVVAAAAQQNLVPARQDVYFRVLFHGAGPSATERERQAHALHQLAFRLFTAKYGSSRRKEDRDKVLPLMEQYELNNGQRRERPVHVGYAWEAATGLWPKFGGSNAGSAAWTRRMIIESVVAATAPEKLCDASDLRIQHVYTAFPTVESVIRRLRTQVHTITAKDFFDTFAAEIANVPGATAEQRRDSVPARPPGIAASTTLLDHQRRALAWMLGRERADHLADLTPFPPLDRPPLRTFDDIEYRWYCNFATASITAARCGSTEESFLLNQPANNAAAASRADDDGDDPFDAALDPAAAAAKRRPHRSMRPLPRGGGVLSLPFSFGKTLCVLSLVSMNPKEGDAEILFYEPEKPSGALDDGLHKPIIVPPPLHRPPAAQAGDAAAAAAAGGVGDAPPALGPLNDADEQAFLDALHAKLYVGATLYVAPVSLVAQIEQEVMTRCAPGFKMLRWHGASRRNFSYADIASADLIISTYETLLDIDMIAAEAATRQVQCWAASRGRAGIFAATRRFVDAADGGAGVAAGAAAAGGDAGGAGDAAATGTGTAAGRRQAQARAADAAVGEEERQRFARFFRDARRKLAGETQSVARREWLENDGKFCRRVAEVDLSALHSTVLSNVWLSRVRFRRVVFDEFHKRQDIKALSRIDADFLWLVSGTPLAAPAVTFGLAPHYGVLSHFCKLVDGGAAAISAKLLEIEGPRAASRSDHVGAVLRAQLSFDLPAVVAGQAAPFAPNEKDVLLTWTRFALCGRSLYTEPPLACRQIADIQVDERIHLVALSARERALYDRAIDFCRGELAGMTDRQMIAAMLKVRRIVDSLRRVASYPHRHRVVGDTDTRRGQVQRRNDLQQQQQAWQAALLNAAVAGGAGAGAGGGAGHLLGGAGGAARGGGGAAGARVLENSLVLVPIHVFAHILFPEQFPAPQVSDANEERFRYLRDVHKHEGAADEIALLLESAAFLCPVCLDDEDESKLHEIVVLSTCCHMFHLSCLKQWAEAARDGSDLQCATCRRAFTYEQPHTRLSLAEVAEELQRRKDAERASTVAAAASVHPVVDDFAEDGDGDDAAAARARAVREMFGDQQGGNGPRDRFGDGLDSSDDDDDEDDDVNGAQDAARDRGDAEGGGDDDDAAGAEPNQRRAKERVPSKFKECLRILREQQDATVKTLIFCNAPDTVRLLSEYLRGKGGVQLVSIDGSTALSARAKRIVAFADPNSGVTACVISARTGNAGLNFQCASQLIIMEPVDRAEVDGQIVGRVRRLGQAKPVVTVHRLVAADTVEPRLLAMVRGNRPFSLAGGGARATAAEKRRTCARIRHLIFGDAHNESDGDDNNVAGAAAFEADDDDEDAPLHRSQSENGEDDDR